MAEANKAPREEPKVPDIPVLVKHVTRAVFQKLTGTERQKFERAFLIARANLTRNKYLSRGSDAGPADRIRTTAAGLRLSAYHAREGGAKSRWFDSLYRKYLAEGPPR